MKITESKRVIILSDSSSPYFAQCIFLLKENVVKEEEKLLNEARCVAERYARRCEKSRLLVKADKRAWLKYALSLAAGAATGAAAVLMIFLF